MFKRFLTLILIFMCLTATSQIATDNSIHQFKVADISGNILPNKEINVRFTISNVSGNSEFHASMIIMELHSG